MISYYFGWKVITFGKNISLDYCLKNEKINLLKKIDWKSINNINTNYIF